MFFLYVDKTYSLYMGKIDPLWMSFP